MHFAQKGAYTGELSADMLKACGVEYVIIGHSERRQYFGETDETVNKRVHAAVARRADPHHLRGRNARSSAKPAYTDAIVEYQTAWRSRG